MRGPPGARPSENATSGNVGTWGGMRSRDTGQERDVATSEPNDLDEVISKRQREVLGNDGDKNYRPPFRQAQLLDNQHLRAPHRRAYEEYASKRRDESDNTKRPLRIREKNTRRLDVGRRQVPSQESQGADGTSPAPRRSSSGFYSLRLNKRDPEVANTAAQDSPTPREPWGRHLKSRGASADNEKQDDRERDEAQSTLHKSIPSQSDREVQFPDPVKDPSRQDRLAQGTGIKSKSLYSDYLSDFGDEFVGFQSQEGTANARALSGEAVVAPNQIEDKDIQRGVSEITEVRDESGLTDEEGTTVRSRRRAGRFADVNESDEPRQSNRNRKARRTPNVRDDEDEFQLRPGSRLEHDSLEGFHREDSLERGKARRHDSENEAPTYEAFGSSTRSPRRKARESDQSNEDVAEARRNRKREKEEKRREKIAQRKALNESKLTPIEIPPFVSIQNLAALLRVRPEEFSSKLSELGFKDVSMDYVLNAENAGLIAMEYGLEPMVNRDSDEDLKPRPEPVDRSSLPQRPPIVTIMGHVDHGKTTLLDYLRNASVAASEHGGITQHIGAFSVPLKANGERIITFLDTPGHAAFLTMRQRGATVTDIVVLVVAADDSVKPQTIEAIKHAKAAGVQMVVAMTKVDKEEADTQRVKQDLTRHGIEVEDFGGDIQAIPVSGKTGQGVEDLEEAIVTLADVLDVRADQDGPVEGWVLEASTKRAGRTATVLVRSGTLRSGSIIVAGKTWARARALRNEAGMIVTNASPGTPVEVDGWRDQPVAGDEVLEANTEQKAASVVEYRQARESRVKAFSEIETINESRKADSERRAREKEAVAEAEAAFGDNDRVTRRDKMEARKAAIAEANKAFQPDGDEGTKELFFVVKADVSGSAEAVAAAVQSIPLGNNPIKISILRSGVGSLSENDVALVSAAPEGRGILMNFGQNVPSQIASLAERSGVPLLDENIIYKVIDSVKEKIEEFLPPVITTRVLGEAEMLQVFEIASGRKNTTKIAGCRVTNGSVMRNAKVRVYRGGAGSQENIVFDGKTVFALNSIALTRLPRPNCVVEVTKKGCHGHAQRQRMWNCFPRLVRVSARRPHPVLRREKRAKTSNVMVIP